MSAAAWEALRRCTQARIALGRAGHALPTAAVLDFQLAHARARDAIHRSWDIASFAGEVAARGWVPVIASTPVTSRVEYLKRPDLGRRLTDESEQCLRSRHDPAIDVALILTNGLSSTAMDRHGLPLLDAIVAALAAEGLGCGPICLAENGRVALSDPVGAALGARLAVMVVGERPGLSADDSLGIYLTYAPGPCNTDAERNCISNVRPPAGLSYAVAARKLAYLARQALRRQLSGVGLKDDEPGFALPKP
ncbi:ethanolamine ammonia-lyase subunit EutC [Methylotetracoccus oryzae]|uniref:ethanolamine ammonia-lyase subunit EutC n=1 Tax=Methylotetracoccus oryzae TaxID=1919059 RepID=UPI00111A7AC2|nr:ethanolamine ammonia-lyase subunit EutC [Methylotetracoccus oryzae]